MNNKPKKILFISPDSGKASSLTQYHAPPLGVVRLAGYLTSKGHYAEYFDPNLYACNKKGLSLKETIDKENWDIIDNIQSNSITYNCTPVENISVKSKYFIDCIVKTKTGKEKIAQWSKRKS